MTQTSGPVRTGYNNFNLLFTICQVFFNKNFIFLVCCPLFGLRTLKNACKILFCGLAWASDNLAFIQVV